MKNILLNALLIIAGCVAGVLFVEIALNAYQGVPAVKLASQDAGYYDVEIYETYFRRVLKIDGTVLCKTRRSRVARESFPLKKGPGTFRIFVLGESVAQGFGASKDVFRTMLREVMPGYDFEIINCGTGGYDSYRILQVARELTSYEPDMMVLLMGNNQWGKDPEKDPFIANSLGRFLYRNSWISRYMHDALKKDEQVPVSASDKEKIFEKNFREIVRLCEGNSIPLVVCTLPSNFRDCPPIGHEPPISKKEYFSSWRALAGGYSSPALGRLERLVEKPEYFGDPFVRFALARALERSARPADARDNYRAALDYDNDNRCTPKRNALLRSAAHSPSGRIVLADLERLFMEHAPHGLTGDDYFQDNCHWWGAYNRLAAAAIIDEVYRKNKENKAGILAPLPGWQYHPSAVDPALLRQERDAVIRNEDYPRKWILWGVRHIVEHNSAFSEAAVYSFRKAYRLSPDRLWEMANSRETIMEEYRKSPWGGGLLERIPPGWPAILCHIGEAYREMGDTKRALYCFNEALRLEQNQPLPYLFRGLTYAALNDLKKMEEDWDRVIEIDGRYAWLRDLHPASR